MFISAIISILFTLVPIAIIVTIVLAVRSKGGSSSGSNGHGVTTARHVWLYLLALISLGIFATGAGQLLALLFDVTIKGSFLTQIGVDAFNLQQLSLGLALTVIGAPLWFLFWRSIQKKVIEKPREIGSGLRKFFLNLIILATSLTTVIATVEFLRWMFEGFSLSNFSGGNLAVIIVAAGIWLYHWKISENEGHPSPIAKTLRRWYVYILSGLGLIWLASGAVQVIDAAVSSFPVWGETSNRYYEFWGYSTRVSLSQLLLGIPIWYFHWFYMAKGDFDSILRQVYFYLLTISGGAIAALVASTVVIFQTLIWVLGSAPDPLGNHFQFLGSAIPTIIAGVAIWGYHLRLVRKESSKVEEKRESAQRVYIYLMSFLGLGTAVAGFILIFGILLDLIINAVSTPLTVSPGWWREQLALCLALLIVGLPLWGHYWNGVLKRVKAGTMAEWRATSRRVFLYVIIGASIIALAASAVNIIYQFLSGLLQGDFGIDILRNSKWSLQSLVVAAPLLWYHWQILREDQGRGAEEQQEKRDVILLTDDTTGELASRLKDKLGYKIHLWQHSSVEGKTAETITDNALEEIATGITNAATGKVLLIITGGTWQIFPYTEE